MHTNMSKLWALIPAAGIGTRMGGQIPKQYLTVSGKPILQHTIACFLSYPAIEKVVVVLAQDDSHWPHLQAKLPKDKILIAIGAEERYQSVYKGLIALQQVAHPDDWVLVHDAVRPCLRHSDLARLIAAVRNHPVGGLLAIPVIDTLKRSNKAGEVITTVDRTHLWRAQTPQMFKIGQLTLALKTAIEAQRTITDEASAIELLGEKPLLVEGHADNIKVTTPLDLSLVERFFDFVLNLEITHENRIRI